MRELIERTEPDLVLNAIVGSAGLGPTIATLSAGIDLALANKESLVVGGELVTALAEARRRADHPRRLRALGAASADRVPSSPGTVTRLVLTASGGPFRGRTDLGAVTREQALAHPTWEMGGKITIDSATLMNKGLELIEAHHLFGVPYERIDVVVHPQSLIHSLSTSTTAPALAHLGHPDMRVPISYALHYPERADVPLPTPRPGRGRRAHLRAARHRDLPLPGASPARPARPGGPRPACSTPPTRSRSRPSSAVGCRSRRSPRWSSARLAAIPAERPTHFEDLFERRRAAREQATARGRAARRAPSEPRAANGGPADEAWVLAIAGFAVLVILHEAGHFAAAKAVGMRVERFFLFFPPKLFSVKRGETEYGIGAIPLGGFVKITGMNPEEEIPEEVADRAYYRQPVWKRIFVIAAGPVRQHRPRAGDLLHPRRRLRARRRGHEQDRLRLRATLPAAAVLAERRRARRRRRQGRRRPPWRAAHRRGPRPDRQPHLRRASRPTAARRPSPAS